MNDHEMMKAQERAYKERLANLHQQDRRGYGQYAMPNGFAQVANPWAQQHLGNAALIRAEALMGMTVLRPEYAVTTQAPRSIHRQGLDRAYNPPPQTNRLARAVFFKPSKAPARARG